MTNSLEHTRHKPLEQRMRNVTRRSVWVIACWEEEPSPIYPSQPDVYLGPFTDYQVEQIAPTLGCYNRIYPMLYDIPAWAEHAEHAGA